MNCSQIARTGAEDYQKVAGRRLSSCCASATDLPIYAGGASPRCLECSRSVCLNTPRLEGAGPAPLYSSGPWRQELPRVPWSTSLVRELPERLVCSARPPDVTWYARKSNASALNYCSRITARLAPGRTMSLSRGGRRGVTGSRCGLDLESVTPTAGLARPAGAWSPSSHREIPPWRPIHRNLLQSDRFRCIGGDDHGPGGVALGT